MLGPGLNLEAEILENSGEVSVQSEAYLRVAEAITADSVKTTILSHVSVKIRTNVLERALKIIDGLLVLVENSNAGSRDDKQLCVSVEKIS